MAHLPRRVPRQTFSDLGRRERQILEILIRRGSASAEEVRSAIADPPSNAAVRGMLRHLEKKGHARHEWDGPRHLWLPVGNLAKARQSAARHLLTTMFGGSLESALAAMLGGAGQRLTASDLDRMAELIERARSRRRG